MKWDTGTSSPSSGSGNVKTKTDPKHKIRAHGAASGGESEPTGPESGLTLSSSTAAGGFVRDDPRVITALEGYLEAIRAGHPWSREEFLAGHSEIAEALEECLSGLDFIQAAAGQFGGSQPVSAAQLAESIPPYAQLGEYRIVREVGRGGMGVVYEAEQVSLGRRVALKVLPFAAAIDPKQRQRFQIEAQAAAQLHHPHIVPIFGVGCEHGIHYYAMQFVDGRSLLAILCELRSGAATHFGSGAQSPGSPVEQPLSGPTHVGRAYCRNVARLGAEAADALEHAHALGIVHRDIKPANIMIDHHDALWITDFGLARCTTDLSLTHTGDMVGTLRYMSPEQAQARGGVVDQRTDIYGLGVTLYELLTLQPAHNGRDHQELLRQIAQDEPVSPRRKNPAVPLDLETIVLKSIAKDPASRYTTAQDLADDLRRFMDDQPILARRPGLPERAMRWAKRHKDLVVTAAAILVLALIAGTAATWVQVRRTEAGKNREHEAFIIDCFDMLDRAANDAINRAVREMQGTNGSAAIKDESRNVEEALKIFQLAIKLPPKDVKSRTVIARAHARLGYARWMLSIMKGTSRGLEPRLVADAQCDFRRSIELFEDLLTDAPDDWSVRRYLASALGYGNLGCCLVSVMKSDEAEPLYRRSIEILRELLYVSGSRRALDDGAATDGTGEADDVRYMVSSVQNLARLLEANGKRVEADGLRRQVENDVVAIAARLSSKKLQPRRSKLAYQVLQLNQMAEGQGPPADQGLRRDAMIIYRLAVILDPESANGNNNLAWSLTNNPSDPWFDPVKGLALARKAVELEPNTWAFLNTLGVAAYRSRDWETAARVLQQSITFTGGGAHDLFFLAMTYWQQGNKKDAREFYARAVAWTEKNKPDDAELRRFRAEAGELIDAPCAKPKSEKSHLLGDEGDACNQRAG
jgi:serine/threonine protein kinase/Tfp pilus assembly protein PilF